MSTVTPLPNAAAHEPVFTGKTLERLQQILPRYPTKGGALLPVLRRLPRRFDRITGAVEQGRLSLNVRLFADERDRRVVTGLTYQFLLAFLGAASGIVGAMLLGTPGGPQVTPSTSLFDVLGYLGLFLATVLILRALVAVMRD